VEKCAKYLVEHKCNTVQGIFRLSGSQTHIQQLKKEFDRGDKVDLNTIEDPHVVAGLLKLYLRELPESIFPNDTYEKLIDAQQNQKEKLVQTFCSILEELAPPNKAVLRYILEILAYIESNSAINKMTSSNLSIVFAPTLLRPSGGDENNISTMVMQTPLINSVMRTIIENYVQILPVLQTKHSQ